MVGSVHKYQPKNKYVEYLIFHRQPVEYIYKPTIESNRTRRHTSKRKNKFHLEVYFDSYIKYYVIVNIFCEIYRRLQPSTTSIKNRDTYTINRKRYNAIDKILLYDICHENSLNRYRRTYQYGDLYHITRMPTNTR